MSRNPNPSAARRAFRWPMLLTRDGSGIAYGADYNPDQWPEEIWDDDIRLMREAHVNVVSLAIFSWARLEPREGEWDFGWLDRIIDKLGGAGIAVDLASATATAPYWLYEKHPEVLPRRADGTVIGPGTRQSWRPTSPVFRRYALETCRKLAERYGTNPAVTAWHVGNEYGWNNGEDYSEDALAAFRRWCRDCYGTIEAANESWGTSFWSQHVNDFDEILLPGNAGGGDVFLNPGLRLDFRRFCSDALKDFYRAERDAIASICPDKPITTNFMVSTDQCKLDYWDWSADVDFVSNDHYFHEGDMHLDELACSDSLLTGFSLGKPWWLMEHSTSAVNWKPYNARKRHGELIRDAVAHVAMGADAICFFQWRQSRFGGEAFHSAMVPHAGEDTQVFRDVCELGELLASFSEAGVPGSLVKPSDVAILFDADAQWAGENPTLPTTRISHWHDVRDWYRAFLDRGVRADVVPLKSDAWSLNGYGTVVLPSLVMLSDESVARLRDFVAAGGTAIVNWATGLVDDRFHVGLGGYPGAGNGLLRELAGVRAEEFNILAPNDGGDPQTIGLSNGCTASVCANVITSVAGSACVLASYKGDEAADWQMDGVPAVVRNAYGEGHVYYVGCDLAREDIARLLADCEPDDGLGRSVAGADADAIDPVLHVVRRGADGTEFDFRFNRMDSDVDTIISSDSEMVAAYRCDAVDGTGCEGGTVRAVLHRNGVLVTRRGK
ncbi:beta-galactosidase [Bifidobacterium vespertilionis]|uniref:beta-galactosidase n=1 Tax=Bifidobacterium vespertilionis TaxID=2562524 RepID=A0A5J5E6J8_9BIFI|nr:beta-galactosidase [Bifidobacterium vespertilionis]KAA8821720.1 beta-galactosidase [Bifidobacterium vespertilionis]KAA8824800.1 beta-galactosidase [Bifidobacterium vespertilionis]